MTHEIINSLRQIGLTQSEANVYIAVLKLGRTTISSIARETTLNRRNIYDVTSTLIEKGLIFTIIGEKERLYAAIEPDKLLEMVESKEKSLERIMPELHNLFNKEFVNDRAMMYQGVEGFKQYLQNVLNVGEDVRCVGAKGGWGFEKLGDFIEWFESERIKKKIKIYNLFDAEIKTIIEEKNPLYNSYAEHRFLPIAYSTNSAFDVFGNHIVTFTDLYTERFDPNVNIYTIINRDLSDAFRIWFQFMWDQCEPVKS